MLVRLLIRLMGGFWILKLRCQRTRFLPLRKMYILLYQAGQFVYGSSIAWNSKFIGVPCFPHGMHGIFVSGDARIGRNCIFFQHVTVGSNSLPDSRGVGAPTIGDNCYIGSGAKIIGNVRIGNNVRVGANSVVYKDVPDNSVVVSNTQNIIRNKPALDNRFYCYQGRWVYFDDGTWITETDPHAIEILESIRQCPAEAISQRFANS